MFDIALMLLLFAFCILLLLQVRLFEYYSDALEQMFQFYATSDKRSKAALVAQAVERGHLAAGPYAATGEELHLLICTAASPY